MTAPEDRHEAHAVDLPFTVDRITDSDGRTPAHLHPEHPVNRLFLADPTVTAVHLIRGGGTHTDERDVEYVVPELRTVYLRVDRPTGVGFGDEALDQAAELVCRTIARATPGRPGVVWPEAFGPEVDAVIDVVRGFATENRIPFPLPLALILRERIGARIRELRRATEEGG